MRVTVTGKGITQDSKRDFNIWVTNYEEPSDAAAPIKVTGQVICKLSLLR